MGQGGRCRAIPDSSRVIFYISCGSYIFFLWIILFLVNHIHKYKERVIEGELRCEQLRKYLVSIGAPMSVFLCEDASGIVKRIAYDSHSNLMIGIVLTMNENTGMPHLMEFKAESAEKMKEYMDKPQSGLVYIVVAQPLKEKAPPFILQIYGTDNKFDKSSVLKRWNYTENELKK